ncbi:MAG TPA: hypothetical protein VE549_09260 [Myxococcaceae bacterium]|jgi:hypothetical protein|nr:hypothetical protein [Myxococcaceae bacterium]
MDTTHRLQDRARDLQDRVGPQIDRARGDLADLNRRLASFIRENPGTCLLGALAFGFIVGKIASRR